MITLPRAIIVGLAAVFSGYHVLLGIASIDVPSSPWPTAAALALYAVATLLSLWPTGRLRLPGWIAALGLATAFTMPLLVSSALDPGAANGYATWYVAAVGTLMTIVAVRGRFVVAWLGVGFLAVHTVVWAGWTALGSTGVLGSIVWVGVAQVTAVTITGAARDAAGFAAAEREASAWKAAQDAHVLERNTRLEQTSRVAAPMLRRIVAAGGELSEQERRECRMLEAGIRDEIRGRMLLDDGVRQAVRAARERGAIVTLLDEGGLDELPEADRPRVHGEITAAVESTDADRIIVRSGAGSSPTAVTVVGRSGLGEADALGAAGEDDDLVLWLEIPRAADDATVVEANHEGEPV